MTIEAARERANAATPGPWEYHVFDSADRGTDVCWTRYLQMGKRSVDIDGNYGKSETQLDKDMRFAARARTEYPLALDVVEAVAEWKAADDAMVKGPVTAEVLHRRPLAAQRMLDTLAAFEAATE